MHKQSRALISYLLVLFSFSAAIAQQPKPPKTLPELQARIQEVLAKPELSSAMVGIKVVSLARPAVRDSRWVGSGTGRD